MTSPLLGKAPLTILLTILLLTTALATPAHDVIDNDTIPASSTAMIGDLLVVRPAGLVATAAGSILFVIALPFTAATHTVDHVANALVINPASYTFDRPLGENMTP